MAGKPVPTNTEIEDVRPNQRQAFKVSKARREKFLEVLSQTGKVIVAAKAAGYSNSTYLQNLKRQDPEFKKAWELAVDVAVSDILEPEAQRRAIDGVKKDIYYKGKVVGFEQQYSDGLLQFLLKGNAPDKYDRKVAFSEGKEGGFGIALLPIAMPNIDDWSRLSKTVHDNHSVINLTPEKSEKKEENTCEIEEDVVYSYKEQDLERS